MLFTRAKNRQLTVVVVISSKEAGGGTGLLGGKLTTVPDIWSIEKKRLRLDTYTHTQMY